MGIFGQNNNASAALTDLISHEDWKLVIMEAKMSPTDASKWSNRKGFHDGEIDSKVLPIHQACALMAPREVIETLIKCYPAGIRMKESAFKRTALHIACQTKAPIETIEALIRYYPEATRIQDNLGRLPIHYACAHEVPSYILDLLLREFPDSAKIGDMNGWLPLHVACRRGVTLYELELLLDCYPQAAEQKTDKGTTPIMCAQKGKSKHHNDMVHYLDDFIRRSKESKDKFDFLSFDTWEPPQKLTEVRHRNVTARGA
jgi:ankyrin repeat protein